MTIAIYQPARGKHHMHRKGNLLTRFLTWLNGEKPAEHEGATETLPVIDAEVIDDALHPEWQPYQPDLIPAQIGETLAAETPVALDRGRVPWIDDFTGWYRTLPVDKNDNDEQLALPAGSAAA